MLEVREADRMTAQRKSRDKIKVGNCVIAERAGRRSAGYAKALHRLREIDRLIANRHGQFVPVERISGYLAVAAFCHEDAASSLAWVRRYTPAAVAGFDDIFAPVRLEKEGRRWNLSGEDAGARVGLTFEERQRLCISTMWAADMPIAEQKEQIKEAKRERERERIAAKRRAKRLVRTAWLAEHAVHRSQPWVSEGISRATWFRRRKPEHETGVSRPARNDETGVLPQAQRARETGVLLPENTFGVPALVSNQPVSTPSIIPEMSDLKSPRRRAGFKPAPNVQLELFESEGSK